MSPQVQKFHFIATEKNLISKTNKVWQETVMAKTADGTRGCLIFGKKISCHPGSLLEAFLKDIADENFAASTISQDDDGEILLSGLASDNLQIKYVLEKEVAKLRDIVNGLSSRDLEDNGSMYKIGGFFFLRSLNGIGWGKML